MRTFSTLLRRKVPLLASASAAVALGLVAIVPVTASAATTSSPSRMTLTGHVLQGTVGARAVVSLVAQPPDSQTDQMAVGQTMHWTPIATGVSSSGGTYSLTFSKAALIPYENPDGTVNLVALAAVAHKFSAYGIVVKMNSGVRAFTTHGMHLWPAPTKAGFPAVASYLAHPQAAAVTPMPTFSCSGLQLQQIYNPQWAKVGETSITITGGETQQFTYQRGQNSSLGIALAESGWSESGTRSMSSSSTVPFAKEGVNSTWVYRSEFRYGLYAGTCGQLTEVYDYWGGSNTISAGAITLTHCATYEGGTSPVFNTTTAATFNAGITVPNLGITLTAQTGWDTTGYITYYMGPNGHKVCGYSGPPGDNPQWLGIR